MGQQGLFAVESEHCKTPDESGEDAECPQLNGEGDWIKSGADKSSQYLKHPQLPGGLFKLGHSGLGHGQSANSVSRISTCTELALLIY